MSLDSNMLLEKYLEFLLIGNNLLWLFYIIEGEFVSIFGISS